ncbi:MAG: eCIS core domain-containing protein [Longimicrobiaceae bacterium]
MQTKLKVNEPGDVYEREADRIADRVMSAPAQQAVSGAPLRIQRFSGQPAGQVNAAPASVDHVLAGPGRPIEPQLRQDMEQRFGYDFSRVRVHSGAAAEQSARDVDAHAYTVGQDIVFGAGRFAPNDFSGRRLIAHELTHVVQQTGSNPSPARSPQMIQRQRANYHAGGCATCTSASAAGSMAHPYAQGLFIDAYGREIIPEAPINNPFDEQNGRLDLLRYDRFSKHPIVMEIGELKPDNDRGVAQGRRDLDWYEGEMTRIFRPPTYLVSRLDALAPTGTVQFRDNTLPGCSSQTLSVRNAGIGGARGLFLYRCDPPGRAPRTSLAPCCTRRRDDEPPDPPIVVDEKPRFDVKGDRKPLSEPKGKGDGKDKHPARPGKPPRWAPEINPAVAAIIIGLAALVLRAAKYFKPLRLAAILGTLLGMLLKGLGLGPAVAGGAAADSADTQPDGPGGPPTVKPVPVPGSGPGDAPGRKGGARGRNESSTEGAPARQARAKRQVVKLDVIEGLNVDRVSKGMVIPVLLSDLKSNKHGVAILQVESVVKEGNDTTAEFRPLQERMVGAEGGPNARTVGGYKVYTVTHPYRGSEPAGFMASVLRTGNDPRWFATYLENVAAQLEGVGQKSEAQQVRTEVQRLRQLAETAGR